MNVLKFLNWYLYVLYSVNSCYTCGFGTFYCLLGSCELTRNSYSIEIKINNSTNKHACRNPSTHKSPIPANNILLLDQKVKHSISHPTIDPEKLWTLVLDQNTLFNWLPDQSLLDQHVLLEGDVESLTKIFFFFGQESSLLFVLLYGDVLACCPSCGSLGYINWWITF